MEKSFAKVAKEIYDTYLEKGFASACEKANEYPEQVTYEFCVPCESETPTITGKSECLICGTKTEPQMGSFDANG